MQEARFIKEFERLSGGEFPELRLNGATYFTETGKLCIRFLLNAFLYKDFTENSAKTAKVLSVLEQIFPGVDIEVKYVKAYADVATVRNKTVEFFNSNNQMLFKKLNDNTLKIQVSDDVIRLTFCFDAPTCRMIAVGTLPDDLKFYLSRLFTERVEIRLEETEQTDEEEELLSSATTVRHTALRLVGVQTGEKLYVRGKIDAIAQLPNYIHDVTQEGDNIVLCGKVENVVRRKYRNKRFNPEDPKSGPEELPIVSFMLNDTTGRMDAVCFPPASDDDCLSALEDGDEVICLGRVATSAFKGTLSYTVNAIFRCIIDYDSIHPVERRPVPERYEVVRPQPYKGISEQQSLLDSSNEGVDKYFEGKTFVVFDLETTSAVPATTQIVEIGAIKVENGVETQTFSTLVKPTVPIPPEATRINHISDDMVEFAPPIEQVLPDFYKFCNGATLVGHNIEGFDLPIVQRIGSEMGYYFDNPTFDTLQKSKQYIRGRAHYDLESLARDLELLHTNAHRAFSDVEATLGLFRYIVKRMVK